MSESIRATERALDVLLCLSGKTPQIAYLMLEQSNQRRLAAPFLRNLCHLHRERVDLAVAAPIFGAAQRPLASVSVAGPTLRLGEVQSQEIGPGLVDAARQIARELEPSGGAPSG